MSLLLIIMSLNDPGSLFVLTTVLFALHGFSLLRFQRLGSFGIDLFHAPSVYFEFCIVEDLRILPASLICL